MTSEDKLGADKSFLEVAALAHQTNMFLRRAGEPKSARALLVARDVLGDENGGCGLSLLLLHLRLLLRQKLLLRLLRWFQSGEG